MKKSIRLLDISKAIYVITMFLAVLLKVNHWPFKEIAIWTGQAFGLLTFIIFYIQYYNEKETEDTSITKEGNTIFNYENENNPIQNQTLN